MICKTEKLELTKQIKDYLIRKGWVCVNNIIDEVIKLLYLVFGEHLNIDMGKC